MANVSVRKDALIQANQEYAQAIEHLVRQLPYELALPEVYEGFGEEALMRIFRGNVEMLRVAGHGLPAIVDIIQNSPTLIFDESGELHQAYVA